MNGDNSVNAEVKSINAHLNSPQTRLSGLQSLIDYLPNCSDENFSEYCVSWMQNCCKTDLSSENTNYVVDLLSTLLKTSYRFPELNKSVSFFISNRFFDHFFKHFSNLPGGWNCAKTCFLYYRGPCGPSQENIKKHLENLMRKNEKISADVSDCLALLPSLGGGGNDGINYQNNWKNQFTSNIYICHSILNDLFVDIEELQTYETKKFEYVCENKHPSFQYLSNLLYNHCKVLNSMLLCSYPTSKSIPTDHILELICRGLAVNPSILGKNETTSVISLKNVLPEIHNALLNLLNSLITTCRNLLLPYSYLIYKLIKQTLEWTQANFLSLSENIFNSLRISAYDVLCNWLVATKCGSSIEKISNLIISQIIRDIECKKNSVTLKGKKSKKFPDKKKKLNLKVELFEDGSLCYAALKALQYFLKFCGVLLKPEDQKFLQETILKLLINIQNSSFTEVLSPYYLAYCRKELYSVLLELVVQPSPKWPPPIHHAVRLFKNGQNDNCLEIVQLCSSALNSITAVIHQQYSNGLIFISEESNRKKHNNKVINLMAKDINDVVENDLQNENNEVEMEIDREYEKNDNEVVIERESIDENETEKQNECLKIVDEKVPENDCSENVDKTIPTDDCTEFAERTIPEKECDNDIEKGNENKCEVDNQKENFQKIFNEKDTLENKKKCDKDKNNGDCIEVELNNKNACVQSEHSNDNDNLLNKSPRKLPFVIPHCEENNTNVIEDIGNNRNDTNKCLYPEKNSFNKELKSIDQNTEEPKTKKIKMSHKNLNVSSNSSQSHSSKLSEPENLSVDEEDDIIICEVVNKNSSEVSNERRKSKRRITEKSASEDSNSEKSVTPGPVDTSYENCKTGDAKKRYFLRSKTGKSSSEEPEELLKKAESLESLKSTPFKDGAGKNTPGSALSVSRRPRTRALSKLKLDENDSEVKTNKVCGDEDEDIIESFNESLVE